MKAFRNAAHYCHFKRMPSHSARFVATKTDSKPAQGNSTDLLMWIAVPLSIVGLGFTLVSLRDLKREVLIRIVCSSLERGTTPAPEFVIAPIDRDEILKDLEWQIRPSEPRWTLNFLIVSGGPGSGSSSLVRQIGSKVGRGVIYIPIKSGHVSDLIESIAQSVPGSFIEQSLWRLLYRAFHSQMAAFALIYCLIP